MKEPTDYFVVALQIIGANRIWQIICSFYVSLYYTSLQFAYDKLATFCSFLGLTCRSGNSFITGMRRLWHHGPMPRRPIPRPQDHQAHPSGLDNLQYSSKLLIKVISLQTTRKLKLFVLQKGKKILLKIIKKCKYPYKFGRKPRVVCGSGEDLPPL